MSDQKIEDQLIQLQYEMALNACSKLLGGAKHSASGILFRVETLAYDILNGELLGENHAHHLALLSQLYWCKVRYDKMMERQRREAMAMQGVVS